MKFQFKLDQVTRSPQVETFSNAQRHTLIVLEKYESFRLNEHESLVKNAAALAAMFPLSLREVETYVRHLRVFDAVHSQGFKNISFGWGLLTLIGVYISCFIPETVSETDTFDARPFQKHFSLSDAPPLGDERSLVLMFALIMVDAYHDDVESPLHSYDVDQSDHVRGLLFRTAVQPRPKRIVNWLVDVVKTLRLSQ